MLFAINKLLIRIFAKLYVVLKKGYYRFFYGKKISLGNNVYFRRGMKVVIEDGGNLSIGNQCFFNYNCSISCLGDIKIGNFCLFGENVKLYDHNHKYSNMNMRISGQGYKIGSIKIGDNCWIGSNVTILNNVTIGDNVVIGANSLIYKSVPSNSVVKNKSQIIIEERKG